MTPETREGYSNDNCNHCGDKASMHYSKERQKYAHQVHWTIWLDEFFICTKTFYLDPALNKRCGEYISNQTGYPNESIAIPLSNIQNVELWLKTFD